jgi:hypothetical protein
MNKLKNFILPFFITATFNIGFAQDQTGLPSVDIQTLNGENFNTADIKNGCKRELY